MGKNKNGFTLIELLAVIVILAIIALIAVPLILNVIDDSKKGAFKSSAYGILGAAEFEYTQSILKGNKQTVTFTYTDGIELSDIEGISLKYKGTKPRNGTVSVNGLGKIALAIHDGKYCAEKDFDSSEVIISEKKVEECQISGDNEAPATPKFLKNFGGMGDDKFFSVINANDGYVTIGSTTSSDVDLLGIYRGQADAIIVKYDLNGNIVWNKNFGGSGYEEFYDIAMVNKGYVIVGYSKSKTGDWEGLNRGNYDAIIAKIDLNGNK